MYPMYRFNFIDIDLIYLLDLIKIKLTSFVIKKIFFIGNQG